MTEAMPPVDAETYGRRRAQFAAIVLSTLGVLTLAVRESTPHPGQSNLLAILAVGLLAYVAPFVFVVGRAMRRGTTRMAAVVVIGVPSLLFLATRAPGNFGQVWPVFTLIVSVVALETIGQLILAGVISRHPGTERRSAATRPVQRARRDSNP